MKKKLKTLDEHNSQAIAVSSFCFGTPVLNGIACPKCGEELYDNSPMVTLATIPAQKTIACNKKGCGYTGYRIA